MKKLLIAAAIASLAAAAAHAAPPPANAQAQTRYRNCLALTSGSPRAALASAESWSKTGGGMPAQHCAALALVALGRYGEAGARLDALARDKTVTDASLRASLHDQAGNAWLLAGNAGAAEASFGAALALDASDPDLFADLARAKAMQKDWSGAEANLNEALALAPKRADLLVLRASARDALGRMKDAFADVDGALLAHRDDPDALVERGVLKLEAGDKDGARRDWLSALAADPRGNASASARNHLDALGVPVKPVPK